MLQFYLRPGRYLRFDGAAREGGAGVEARVEAQLASGVNALSIGSGDAQSTAGAHAQLTPSAGVEDLSGNVVCGVPLDPRNTLAGFAGEADVQTLLQYTTPPKGPAAVELSVGKGRVAIVAPNLESPSTPPADPSASSTSPDSTSPSPHASTSPSPHVSLLHPVLASLGLRIPDSPAPAGPPRPQPQFLTANPKRSGVISRITHLLAAAQAEEAGGKEAAQRILDGEKDQDSTVDTIGSQLSVWEDSEDTFCFWPLKGAVDAVKAAQSGLQSDEGQDSATDNKDAQGKKGSHRHIVLCPDGELPPRDLTPNFDLEAFYEALDAARGRSGSGVSNGRSFRHDLRLVD